MGVKNRSASRSTDNNAFAFHFEAKTDAQAEFLTAFKKNEVVVISGPAGSGKTIAAVAAAVIEFQASRGNKRIIVLRPTVETGPSVGFLPGTLSEKIDPFMTPFKQALHKVAFNFPLAYISFEAVGFQRGVTYDNCSVIVDEAQNLTFKQLTMLSTRLGRNCKMVFIGDPDQSDIRSTVKGYGVDLDAFVDSLDGLLGVAIAKFPDADSLRNPLVGKMLERLRRFAGR